MMKTRRMARPMVTLARLPGPNRPWPQLIPISLRMGPFNSKTGTGELVDAEKPWTTLVSSSSAFRVVTSTGKYSGKQPAMTAQAAAFSALRMRRRIP